MANVPISGLETAVSTPCALSPLQHGMLFQHLYGAAGGVDIGQLWLTLDEILDFDTLRRALDLLAARREEIRTYFLWEDLAEPRQEVAAAVSLPLPFADWSHLSQTQAQAQFQEFLRADRRRGFDLRQPPLIRFHAFRWPGARTRLQWSCHHILFDGHSHVLLLEDLYRAYQALCGRRPVELGPTTPFRDFIHWLDKLDISDADYFWQRHLAGVESPTPVPCDSANDAARLEDEGTGFETWTLPAALREAVKAFAGQCHLGINAIVLGAWALLLSRYGQCEDVVFGTVLSARGLRLLGAESMVGVPMTTVPLRVRLREEERLPAYLRDIQASLVEIAMQNPWKSSLADIRRASTLAAPAKLFETLVVFDRNSLSAAVQARCPQWGDTHIEIRGNTGYALSLHAYAEPEIKFGLEYDRRRLDRGAIRRLFDQLETTMASFAAAPEQALDEVEWIPAAKKRQLLVDWNQTATSFPHGIGAHELVERQAGETPGRTAVTCAGTAWSYGTLNAQANRLAHLLRAQGVGRGQRVGISVERSPWLIAAMLATWKAGAAYVPLDPTYPAARLAFMAEDAQLAALITETHFASLWGGRVSVRLIRLDADAAFIAAQNDANPGAGAGGEDLAYVLYTSGSTGKPKGAAIPHRALVNFLFAMREAPGISADDVVLAMTTISFDIAALELILPLTVGARVEILDRETARNGELLQRAMLAAGATLAQATPATWQILLESGWRGQRGLRILTGGEALSPSLAASLLTCGDELWNGYGPTEATVYSTMYRVRSAIERTVPIGRPVSNTLAYVLDRRLRPMPIGAVGELYLGGSGLAIGYLNRPDLTAERFIPDPLFPAPGRRLYKTGDLARFRDDGNLEYLGRADRQVKLRGYRIELGEIEAVLSRHPEVSEAAVTLREHPPGRKFLAAYFVPAPGAQPQSAALRRFLADSLPDYMVPVSWVPLAALPRTLSGKIDRQILPAPEMASATGETSLPRNDMERQLAEIWQEMLGTERIGPRDNFFELGGDSLLAVRLFSRITARMGVKLSLNLLFQRPTVEALAEAITHPAEDQGRHGLIPIQTAGTLPQLFWVPGGRAVSALSFREVSLLLGREQPVYGFESRLPKGDEDFATVEERAAAYLEVLRARQLQGPYNLVGYCLGGLVVFEMARRLAGMGMRVGMVALVNAGVPDWRPTFAQNWRRRFQHLRDLGPRRAAGLLGHRFAVRPRNGATSHSAAQAWGDDLDDALDASVRRNAEVMLRYRPGTFPGAVHLFLSAESEYSGVTPALDPRQGWRRFAASTICAVVPGNHISMLCGANARIFSARLREALNAAQSAGAQ